MLTLFILWIRKDLEDRVDKYTLNHETIRMYQQLEILGASFIPGLLLCLFGVLNWWWMLFFILLPLLIYVVCWIIEIILPPYNSSYKNICFKSEAMYNEGDLDYFSKRKLFQFSWLKYISNKKYPYLTYNQRMDLHRK